MLYFTTSHAETPEYCILKFQLDSSFSYNFDHMIKIVCKYTWFVCKYDQNCLQMSHLAGILDSSIPGFLQAWW